jgi:hypothetical protein
MSAVFQLGYYPIRTVMYSRYLSVSGFRFLRLPTATEELGLPYGFLTGTSLPDLIGVTPFRTFEMRLV